MISLLIDYCKILPTGKSVSAGSIFYEAAMQSAHSQYNNEGVLIFAGRRIYENASKYTLRMDE